LATLISDNHPSPLTVQGRRFNETFLGECDYEHQKITDDAGANA